MSALRSLGLPAALLAATGGVALATWRYLSTRRQKSAEHGDTLRVEEEGNVEAVSPQGAFRIGGQHEDVKQEFRAGTAEEVSAVQNVEGGTGSLGSDGQSPPGTSPVCQEEKNAAVPVTSPVCQEEKSAAAPVTSPVCQEEKSAAAPVTSKAVEEKSAAAPVTSPVCQEEKSAAAPVTSVTAEEKSAAAPVTSVTAEEKSAAAPVTSVTAEESAAAPINSMAAEEKSAAAPVTSVAAEVHAPRSSVDPPVEKGIGDSLSSAEIEHKEKHAPCKQVLVLGLDGAGKTSILNSIAANKGKLITTPTEGVNAMCVSNGNSKMDYLEIGGSEQLRPYWKMYLARAFAVIFVVDSADHGRLPLAKRHLHQLIQQDSVLPLLVLANKQDLETAHHIPEIHDALALSEICEKRKLFLIGTYVTKEGSEVSSGIQDTKEFLAHLLLENSEIQ